jgi:phage shock protein A
MQEIEDMSGSDEKDLDKQFAALESSSTSADLLLEDLKKKMHNEEQLPEK